MKTLEKNQPRTARKDAARLYNPWDPFSRNDFLDFWDGDKVAETIPPINVTEEEDRYKLEMDAPGLKKEDFNIEVDENVMTISCEKEAETSEGGKGKNSYSRKEYSYTSFSRSFTIPDHANVTRMVTEYKDGILSLNIPKASEVQQGMSRKIQIQPKASNIKNKNAEGELKEEMKTLTSCLNSLSKSGFKAQFKVTDKGLLSLETENTFGPDEVKVRHFYRFEGESDPSDNSIVYAIETNNGEKGTLVDAFGPYSDSKVTKFMQQVEEIKK